MKSNNQSVHFISYASGRFIRRAAVLREVLLNNNWFTTFTIKNETDLEENFKNRYRDILDQPRGGGYWLWKSEIIRQKLKEINENDILVYADGGCTLNLTNHSKPRFDQYIDMCNDNDMLRFILDHNENKYTNSTTINYFKTKYNIDEIHTRNGQLMATVIIVKNTQCVRDFFDTFFKIIDDDRMLITDHYNDIDKQQEFIDHRHDQSILSLLTKSLKFGIILKDETYHEDWINCISYPILATRLQ